MIVAALFEFAIVLILKHHPRNTKIQLQTNNTDANSTQENSNTKLSNQPNDQETDNKGAWVPKDISQPKKSMHEKIDYACFLFFPIIFVLFNAIYFSVFLSV